MRHHRTGVKEKCVSSSRRFIRSWWTNQWWQNRRSHSSQRWDLWGEEMWGGASHDTHMLKALLFLPQLLWPASRGESNRDGDAKREMDAAEWNDGEVMKKEKGWKIASVHLRLFVLLFIPCPSNDAAAAVAAALSVVSLLPSLRP